MLPRQEPASSTGIVAPTKLQLRGSHGVKRLAVYAAGAKFIETLEA